MTDGETYQIEDAELLHNSDKAKAILINSEETGKVWIPKSQLIDMDMKEVGDEGCIEITGWLAKQIGLGE